MKGKMLFMSEILAERESQTSISLDGAGRVVLPKSLQDSLGLVPGEPLVAEQRGGAPQE
jgi:bifunctional DNA-binding transcriptional regulator/antitoxin component of YhaV-PrlF toxin-antitoxin module